MGHDEREGVDVERANAAFQLMVEKLGAPPSQLRKVGRGSSSGFGRCVVSLPIQEVVAEQGPVPNDLTPGARPGLFFDNSDVRFTDCTSAILGEMARWLRTEEDNVRLEGHCDMTEDASIGQRRATAVKDALVAKGVDSK